MAEPANPLNSDKIAWDRTAMTESVALVLWLRSFRSFASLQVTLLLCDTVASTNLRFLL